MSWMNFTKFKLSLSVLLSALLFVACGKPGDTIRVSDVKQNREQERKAIKSQFEFWEKSPSVKAQKDAAFEELLARLEEENKTVLNIDDLWKTCERKDLGLTPKGNQVEGQELLKLEIEQGLELELQRRGLNFEKFSEDARLKSHRAFEERELFVCQTPDANLAVEFVRTTRMYDLAATTEKKKTSLDLKIYGSRLELSKASLSREKEKIELVKKENTLSFMEIY